MILYFSGTGNSAYVAARIGEALHDETLDLFERLRSRDFSPLHSDRPWVVVTPTYAWRIPRIVQEWLEKTPLTGSRDIYFVMTCGENIGSAGKYTDRLCATKGMNSLGCIPVVMPENYIALFKTPDEKAARPILRRAKKAIDEAARLISSRERYQPAPFTLRDNLCSSIVNAGFYPFFVHAKKFAVTDACISCGKCVQVCPLSNITLENGKPVWGKRCTHCMACICRCPAEAIEYGRHSRGLPRYTCPEMPE